MEPEILLNLVLHANRLKVVPRTGWIMRGVRPAESVADHIFGTAFIALILAEIVTEPIDLGKLLVMALLHDLPECLTTDLPQPAARLFPPGAKRQAELNALNELLSGFDFGDRYRDWWLAAKDGTSVEARILRDADRLELLIQAHVYGQTTAEALLDEFWEGQEDNPFELDVSQAVFATLLRRLKSTQRSVVSGWPVTKDEGPMTDEQ